jgi:hypothetical protein
VSFCIYISEQNPEAEAVNWRSEKKAGRVSIKRQKQARSKLEELVADEVQLSSEVPG